MMKTTGRVTLPIEENFLHETKELMERWGADALRDSDGTKMEAEMKQLDAKIYTTYFVARGRNDFAEQHPEEMQQYISCLNLILRSIENLRLIFSMGILLNRSSLTIGMIPKNGGRSSIEQPVMLLILPIGNLISIMTGF